MKNTTWTIILKRQDLFELKKKMIKIIYMLKIILEKNSA